jgi:hypothetical protein
MIGSTMIGGGDRQSHGTNIRRPGRRGRLQIAQCRADFVFPCHRCLTLTRTQRRYMIRALSQYSKMQREREIANLAFYTLTVPTDLTHR